MFAFQQCNAKKSSASCLKAFPISQYISTINVNPIKFDKAHALDRHLLLLCIAKRESRYMHGELANVEFAT